MHPTEVAHLLDYPKKEQDIKFRHLRIMGINKHNLENPNDIMKEKKGNPESTVQCPDCSLYISKVNKKRHQCFGFSSTTAPGPSSSIDGDQFSLAILQLHLDKLGIFIRENDFIRRIGKFYFRDFCNSEKEQESRTKVRTFMRTLSNIFLEFQSRAENNVVVKDLFFPKNVELLTDIIEKLGHGKPSVMLNQMNTIQKAAKISANLMLIDGFKADRDEITSFITLIDQFWIKLRRTAENNLEKRRNEVNRNPINLPSASTIKNLFMSIIDILENLLNDNNRPFLSTRRYLSSFMTLLNARRGQEVHRLTIKQCQEGLSGYWMNNEMALSRLTEEEKETINNNIIFYVPAKKAGDNVVIVINKYYAPLIEHLIDSDVRKDVGVLANNKYVFPSLHSAAHCAGWKELDDVQQETGIKVKLNATKIRHFAAEAASLVHMTSTDRTALHSHFGHSETINSRIYQCPKIHQKILIQKKLEGIILSKSPNISSATPGGPTASSKKKLFSTPKKLPVRSTPKKLPVRSVKRKYDKIIECGDLGLSDDSDGDPTVECPDEDTSDDSDENFDNEVKVKKSCRWSETDQKIIYTKFRSYIDGSDDSPRPHKKNILPLVRGNQFDALTGMDTPVKIEKVRRAVYNKRKLNFQKKK